MEIANSDYSETTDPFQRPQMQPRRRTGTDNADALDRTRRSQELSPRGNVLQRISVPGRLGPMLHLRLRAFLWSGALGRNEIERSRFLDGVLNCDRADSAFSCR